MSVISKLTMLGAAGSGGAAGWFTQYTYPGTDVKIYGGVIDGSDNIFVVGNLNSTPANSTATKSMLLRLDVEGAIGYKKFWGESNENRNHSFNRVAYDGSAYLYCVGNTYLSSTSSYSNFHKITASSGSESQSAIRATDNGAQFYGVGVRSDGALSVNGELYQREYTNAYGDFPYFTSTGCVVATSGSITSQVGIENNKNPSDESEVLRSYSNIIVDSSNNSYFCGGVDEDGAGGYAIILHKFLSGGSYSGSWVWYRNSGSGTDNWGEYVAFNSLGDVTVCGRKKGANTSTVTGVIGVLDVSTGGQTVYHPSFSNSGSPNIVRTKPYACIYDENDDFYFCGIRESQTNSYKREAFVVKTNSNFAPQWTSVVEFSDGDLYPREMLLDSGGNLYVVGWADNSSTGRKEGWVIKMTADSGLTAGTFGDFTVTNPTITTDSPSGYSMYGRSVATHSSAMSPENDTTDTTFSRSLTVTQTEL